MHVSLAYLPYDARPGIQQRPSKPEKRGRQERGFLCAILPREGNLIYVFLYLYSNCLTSSLRSPHCPRIHFELQQISCFLHRVGSQGYYPKAEAPPLYRFLFSILECSRRSTSILLLSLSSFSSPTFSLSRQYIHEANIFIADTNRACVRGRTPHTVPPVYPPHSPQNMTESSICRNCSCRERSDISPYFFQLL